MHGSDSSSPPDAAGALAATVALAAVRDDLARIEALEREVRLHTAQLRTLLPAEHARPVWDARDAEQRLALAERVLAEQHLVQALARLLPEQAARIRAEARRVLGDDHPAGIPA